MHIPKAGRKVHSHARLSGIINRRITRIRVSHAYHVKLHAGPVAHIARMTRMAHMFPMACTQYWGDANTH